MVRAADGDRSGRLQCHCGRITEFGGTLRSELLSGVSVTHAASAGSCRAAQPRRCPVAPIGRELLCEALPPCYPEDRRWCSSERLGDVSDRPDVPAVGLSEGRGACTRVCAHTRGPRMARVTAASRAVPEPRRAEEHQDLQHLTPPGVAAEMVATLWSVLGFLTDSRDRRALTGT